MFGPVDQPWLLPRVANPQYVGYTDILNRLERCLLPQAGAKPYSAQVICVLSGMGGVGKSETILQCVGTNDTALRER